MNTGDPMWPVAPSTSASTDPRLRAAGWIVTAGPDRLPVTTEEALAHLRVDAQTESTYIDTLIAAATDYAEDRLGSCLVPRTF